MNRERKKQVIGDISSIFDGFSCLVLVRVCGLTVAETTGLRVELRKLDARLRHAKNNLAKAALADYEGPDLSSHFAGSIVVAYSNDVMSLAKFVADCCAGNAKMELVCGVYDGKFLSPKDLKRLASIPSMECLMANIAHIAQHGVVNKICGRLQAHSGLMVNILRHIAKSS